MKRLFSLFTLCVVLTVLFSCGKEGGSNSASLKIIDSTALSEIPADGGSYTLIVDWTNCKFKVSYSGTNGMISNISPVYAGASSSSGFATITLEIAANSYKTTRSTTIRVQDTASDTYAECEITQAAATGSSSQTTTTTEGTKISVDASTTYQTIDGFGAMNGWGIYDCWDNSTVDKFYKTLGLSIMRILIPHDESQWSTLLSKCKYVYNTYGIKILATPWTMPASWKDPEQTEAYKDNVKSYLKPEYYEEYANYLEKFAAYMSKGGVPLYAISMQNEPDWTASYDGCIWTSTQMYTFLKNYGHIIKSAKLMTGESLNMNQDFYKESLNDATACANIDIVGGHLYGSGLKKFSLAESKGKPIWMTEHLLNESWENNTDHWAETMEFVQEVASCFKLGWNAYIYWWAVRYYGFIGDGTNDTIEGAILPRGYAFGQFSKYIKPGYTRIEATSNNEAIDVTAFSGDGKIVVVLINTGKAGNITVDLGTAASGASATYTSSSANNTYLKVTTNGNEASLNLPASSIITLVL